MEREKGENNFQKRRWIFCFCVFCLLRWYVFFYRLFLFPELMNWETGRGRERGGKGLLLPLLLLDHDVYLKWRKCPWKFLEIVDVGWFVAVLVTTLKWNESPSIRGLQTSVKFYQPSTAEEERGERKKEIALNSVIIKWLKCPWNFLKIVAVVGWFVVVRGTTLKWHESPRLFGLQTAVKFHTNGGGRA